MMDIIAALVAVSALGYYWWKANGFAVLPMFFGLWAGWILVCHDGNPVDWSSEWVYPAGFFVFAAFPWSWRVTRELQRRNRLARSAAALQALGFTYLKGTGLPPQ